MRGSHRGRSGGTNHQYGSPNSKSSNRRPRTADAVSDESRHVKKLSVLPAKLQTKAGLPRRPFLQLIILFASDPRVMHYANSVAAAYLEAGIDVWLMTELPRLGDESTPRWIKPDQLVSIISQSRADRLVVIGDRNMKNETCQERRSGKLCEVSVSASVDELLKQWARDTGLRYVAPLDNLEHYSEERLLAFVKDLTGECGHARNRLDRLVETSKVLKRWKEVLAKSSTNGKKSRRRSSTDTSMDGLDFLSEPDQQQVERLTKSQTAAIKLHSELVAANVTVDNLLTMDINDPRNELPQFRVYLGLGRGVDVSQFAGYCPNAPGMAQEGVELTMGPVPARIKKLLLNMLNKLVVQVNDVGEAIASVAATAGGLSLWRSYKDSNEGPNGKLKASRTPQEEQLLAMGFELHRVQTALASNNNNVEGALNVLLQDTSGGAETRQESEEWSMTGNAGKLQRQKKKQEQERQEQERQQRNRRKQQNDRRAKTKQQPKSTPKKNSSKRETVKQPVQPLFGPKGTSSAFASNDWYDSALKSNTTFPNSTWNLGSSTSDYLFSNGLLAQDTTPPATQEWPSDPALNDLVGAMEDSTLKAGAREFVPRSQAVQPSSTSSFSDTNNVSPNNAFVSSQKFPTNGAFSDNSGFQLGDNFAAHSSEGFTATPSFLQSDPSSNFAQMPGSGYTVNESDLGSVQGTYVPELQQFDGSSLWQSFDDSPATDFLRDLQNKDGR